MKPFEKTSLAKASFFCGIFPYILYGFCYIMSGGGPEFSGGGLADGSEFWSIFLLYGLTAMLPVWACSVDFGVISLRGKDRIYAYIGIALSLFPIILLFAFFI